MLFYLARSIIKQWKQTKSRGREKDALIDHSDDLDTEVILLRVSLHERKVLLATQTLGSLNNRLHVSLGLMYFLQHDWKQLTCFNGIVSRVGTVIVTMWKVGWLLLKPLCKSSIRLDSLSRYFASIIFALHRLNEPNKRYLTRTSTAHTANKIRIKKTEKSDL